MELRLCLSGLSCQIGCSDRCIVDGDGAVVVTELVVLVVAVIVMSLGVVVVVLSVVDALFAPASCARTVVIIVIGVVGLKATNPPARSINTIIMMETVAEVLLSILLLFLEKNAILSLSPLSLMIIDIV